MKGKDIKYSVLLIAIVLVGFVLRVRLSQDTYLHKWDERFHALVAKNLMQNPLKPTLYENTVLNYDYKAWYSNHIWLHKQPLPLWLIAISYKTFGISEFSTRVPSILFSVISIYVLYLLGKHLFNRRTGILAAFFFSINGLVIEMCSGRIATDHYDTLFQAFIIIAVLFAYYNSVTSLKRYALISGAFLGFAILTKWLPALIILPIHFFLLRHAGYTIKAALKPLALSIMPALIIALPWQIFILNQYPLEAKWEYYHNWLHITTQLDKQTGGYFYFLNKIRINYSEIIYIPLIFLMYNLYKSKFKDFRSIAMFVWIFIPILFFSLAKTKMQGYVLFICPALFLITADFYFNLIKNIKSKERSMNVKVLTIIILTSIIILPIRYCYERTSFGLERPKYDNITSKYKNTPVKLSQNSVVIGVREPIEFMFYNNCIAYSDTILKVSEIERIRNLNYNVYVFNDKLNSIELVKFQ